MNKILPICVFLCLSATESKAGEGDKPLGSRDSTYISIPDRPWSFRAYTVNKVLHWKLDTKTDSISPVRYNPNNRPGFGVGVFHRSFGAWIGLRVDQKNRREDQIQLDLQLNQYGKAIYTDLYLQYYRGFRLDNTFAHIPQGAPVPSEDIQRDDISFFSTGINMNYLLNWKKFSMRAAFIQSELQKKSVGSFYVGGSFNTFGFQGDSSVVPNSAALKPEDAVKRGTYFSAGINGGYSFTLVWWKSWYANATLGVGVGALLWNQELQNEKSQFGVRPMFRSQGRISAGYNSRHWFAGFSLILDNLNLAYRGNNVDYQLGNSRLFIGYRPNF